MRGIGTWLILIVVIVAVSAGVYIWMDERDQGPFEEAGENMDQAVEELADETQPN